MKTKTVIYKENGVFKTTTQENYNAIIQDAFKVTKWEAFESAEEIINYCVQYCKANKEDFIIYMDAGLSVLASTQATLLRKTYFEVNETKWWMEFYSKTTYYRERDRASRSFLRCVM